MSFAAENCDVFITDFLNDSSLFTCTPEIFASVKALTRALNSAPVGPAADVPRKGITETVSERVPTRMLSFP